MNKNCLKADVELGWTWDGGDRFLSKNATSTVGYDIIPELEPMRLEMRQYHQTHTIQMRVPVGRTARLPCPVRQLGNRKVIQYVIQLLLVLATVVKLL